MLRTRASIVVACVLVTAGAIATLVTLALVATSAPDRSAAPAVRSSCAAALIRDWSDGRIERSYSVSCYRAALHSLPADLRVYSSAPDDIRQAMSARIVQSSHPRKLAAHG